MLGQRLRQERRIVAADSLMLEQERHLAELELGSVVHFHELPANLALLDLSL